MGRGGRTAIGERRAEGGCAGRATGACQVGCQAEARRVQPMVKMKPASSPRAATRHPAEARCRSVMEPERLSQQH